MVTRRATLGLAAAAAPAIFLATRVQAMEPPVFQPSGLAIHGIDPVAYFSLTEDADPVPGRAGFTLDWNGATWRFASAEHRAMFEAAPEDHAPAFGGYCAFAAANGYLADTVPEAWSVVEGRLFLNASVRVRRRWLRLLPDAIAQGDANWPGILG